MDKFKKCLTISIILAVIAVCAIFVAYNNYKKYEIVSNNSYNSSFYELVDNVNNVKNYLLKSLITNDAMQSAKTLVYIWKESNLAQVYLSQIPISNEGISNTQKFLNQASEYSYTLAIKNQNGERLTQDELNNLKQLYNYSVEVNGTLNQIMQEVNSGILNWKQLSQDGSSMFNKDENNTLKGSLDTIETNFEEYDGLIYDGAYSEHITNMEKEGLTGEEISEEDAKKIVESFVENKEIEAKGLSENGTIQVYTFECNMQNENKIVIAISKKGGHIVFMNYNREIEEEVLNYEDADKKALEFLNSKGFKNMQKTYYIKEAGIITINYAYEQEGVIVYPDLIKVKVALDTGEILGIETTGYLNNHKERNINKTNIISNVEAAKNINENLNIEQSRLAIIPTKFRTEKFCWELKGTIEDKNFLIYVNANTGKVEDVLVIIDNQNGILTE